MATVTPLKGAVTALTFAAGDSTLASGAFAVSSAIDLATLGSGGIAALDALLTISAGIAATAVANDTVDVYLVPSIDGATFSDAPADGSTDATHNSNMRYFGSITVPSAVAATVVFPVTGIAPLFDVLPAAVKVAVYNGSGAALTSLAGSIQGYNESVA